jgi:hypothetical protein
MPASPSAATNSGGRSMIVVRLEELLAAEPEATIFHVSSSEP